ncbi:MAG: hypothetical protein ACLPZM_02775 [Thermoplasmata archaeon]
MPRNESDPDPTRATLVAILQQLNRVESINEGRSRDQSLELKEVERLLEDFWAVHRDHVKVPLALGLLVRNGLVEGKLADRTPAEPAGPRVALYRITSEGKAFLVEAQENTDRIQ